MLGREVREDTSSVPCPALGIALPVHTDCSAGTASEKGRKATPAFSPAPGGFLPSLGSAESLLRASPAQLWPFYLHS